MSEIDYLARFSVRAAPASRAIVAALLVTVLVVVLPPSSSDPLMSTQAGQPVPTVTPDTPSDLKPIGPPPEGVSGQLSFFPVFPAFGIDCPAISKTGQIMKLGLISVSQRSTIVGPIVEKPSECVGLNGVHVWVLLDGFVPNLDIAVAVIRPDGLRLERRVRASDVGRGEWQWSTLPGAPHGVYLVQANQGDLVATGNFTIAAATRPIMTVLPRGGRAGTTFAVGFVGFQSHEAVPVQIYRELLAVNPSTFNHIYVASLPPISLDDDGEGIARLGTRYDDMPGSYLLIPSSQVAAINQLDLWEYVIIDAFDQLRPTRIVVDPPSGPAGTAFHVALTGFSPMEVLYLRLRKQGGTGSDEFETYLPRIDLDVKGSGSTTMLSRRDDPTGQYIIDVEAGPFANDVPSASATFEIR